MAATATMARLPRSACAAERERPRPVLMSATPAMASGANEQKRKRERENSIAHGRERGCDGIHGSLAPRASMWPRTATAKPIPSTARPHSTNTVLARRVRKQHQRSKGEKESGWHHQQSGVFHHVFLAVPLRPRTGGEMRRMGRQPAGGFKLRKSTLLAPGKSALPNEFC